MKKIVALALAASFAAAMSTGALAAKKTCVKAGGEGTGITSDIAKTMATAALNNSISSFGGKGTGKVSMTCKQDLVINTCVASQRACK